MIYYKQEKYNLAEVHFKKALTINPSSAVLLCHIGVVSHVWTVSSHGKLEDVVLLKHWFILMLPIGWLARKQCYSTKVSLLSQNPVCSWACETWNPFILFYFILLGSARHEKILYCVINNWKSYDNWSEESIVQISPSNDTFYFGKI
jgi:tetratricopeptide (TPR) repeat protein